MIRPAIACRIILFLFRLRRRIAVSYSFCGFLLFGVSLSYSVLRVVNGPILASCGFWVLAVKGLVSGRSPEKGRRVDYEQDFGGSGPRVIGYIRVSSSDQAKGLSPETQEEELLAWARMHHPSYLYMKFDNGKSGIDFTRRKIGEISKLKKEGKVTELWVRAVDRLGRDTFELVTFFLDFLFEGGKIRSQEGIFTREKTSFITFVMLAFSAQISNETKAQAAVASKKRSFRLGKWNKRVPFGYVKTPDGWIQKDLAKQEIVLEIFHIFLLRKSIAFARREVSRRYHLVLSRDKLRIILGNPVYYGEPSLSGEVVQDESLAFIPKNEFVRIQAMLQETDLNHKGKATELFQTIVINDVTLLHDFIAELRKHFMSCRGEVQVNGARYDTSRPQLAFFCPSCGHHWRFPRRIPEEAIHSSPLVEQDYRKYTMLDNPERRELGPVRLSKADGDLSLDLFSNQ